MGKTRAALMVYTLCVALVVFGGGCEQPCSEVSDTPDMSAPAK